MTAPSSREPELTRSRNGPVGHPDHPGHPGHPGHPIRPARTLSADAYTTLVAVDIAGFGHPSRDTGAHLLLRRRLYDHLIEAFTATGLPWRECHCEDRGDGAFVVAPAGAEPGCFLDPLARRLHAILRRENRRVRDVIRIQLRMAVHHGRVQYDPHGVAGLATVHVFRLLEAPAFKGAARAADADLAMIVSDRLHADVVRRGGSLDPAAYRQILITNKETRARAWLWLPAGPAAPAGPV